MMHSRLGLKQDLKISDRGVREKMKKLMNMTNLFSYHKEDEFFKFDFAKKYYGDFKKKFKISSI